MNKRLAVRIITYPLAALFILPGLIATLQYSLFGNCFVVNDFQPIMLFLSFVIGFISLLITEMCLDMNKRWGRSK
jgi:hypothetical protein